MYTKSKAVNFSRVTLAIFTMLFALTTQVSFANENGGKDESCDTNLTGAGQTPAAPATTSKAKAPAKAAKAAATPAKGAGSSAYQRIMRERGQVPLRAWTLADFFSDDEASNLALSHPFTVANAAEKAYALLTYKPPQKTKDPLYNIKPTQVYPLLTGDPLAGGRMVIGNEEALDSLVSFIGSKARGDRSGKAIGFPGPAGTGKTELLYVIDQVERNLGRTEDKFRQFSYRWVGLDKVPALKKMFIFDKATGEPNYRFIDPDMPRSPFTLLRDDMKASILAKLLPKIRQKWNMTISKGWTKTEPKSAAIITAILEDTYPEIAEGLIKVSDLTEEEYLGAISKYIVIVPKEVVQQKVEPQIIRAQSDDPNFEALFARPNLLRQAFYAGGKFKDLGVDYVGQVFQQDGGLLMFDELYRNSGPFLNILLEVKQNAMVQTDYGDPVEIDAVPIWNSNDESIEQAKQDQALKASIDRDEPNPMRLLLDPEQIEKTALFQVEINKFSQRLLSETGITPLVVNEVYPAPDADGKTTTAYGRYALYYRTEDQNILIAPMTLNYMAWVAAATRYETDRQKMAQFQRELNLVARDPSLFTNPITRLKIILGEREINGAEKAEFYKISKLLEEGRNGISARDIETWIKKAINIAIREHKGVVTPRMMDQALEEALNGEIKPANGQIRAYWLTIRQAVKLEILLPRIAQDVRNIISGDGDKANRVYDEVEREFIELAQSPDASRVQPDDGSQPIIINRARLAKIKEKYRERNGREFSPNFLFRNLRGARNGSPGRDAQLLEAVRDFVAEQETMTTDYISAFNAFYEGKNTDPTMSEKVAMIESSLAQFGYDQASFREAVAFTEQLKLAKIAKEQSEED